MKPTSSTPNRFSYALASLLLSFPGSLALRALRHPVALFPSVSAILAFWTVFLASLYAVDCPWQNASLVFLLVNGISGFLFCFWASRNEQNPLSESASVPAPSPAPSPSKASRTLPQFFWALGEGAVFGALVAIFEYHASQNVLDPLLGHLIPLNASPYYLVGFSFGKALWGALFGAVSGVLLFRRRDSSPSRWNRWMLSAFLWFFSGTLFSFWILEAPSFWNLMNDNPFSNSLSKESLYFQTLFWIYGVSVAARASRWKNAVGFFRACLLEILLCLSLGLSALGYFGLKSEHLLVWGRFSELSGNWDSALNFYRKSLRTRADPFVESYLQYRIGILHYKKGESAKAQKAFENLVVKYPSNTTLVARCRYFLRRLESTQETPPPLTLKTWGLKTALKDNYCAPNALAFVLGYWEKPVPAREIGASITRLSAGTSFVDMVHFLEAHDLTHFTKELADKEDILGALREKIPVLGYIPGHVFAIHGYDARLDALFVYDVAQSDFWVEYPWPDFEAEWEKSGRQIGLVYPSEKAPEIESRLRLNPKTSQAVYLRNLLLEHPVSAVQTTETLLKTCLALDPQSLPNQTALLSHNDLFSSHRALLQQMQKGLFLSGFLDYWNRKKQFDSSADPYYLQACRDLAIPQDDWASILKRCEERGTANWLVHYLSAVLHFNRKEYPDTLREIQAFEKTVNDKSVLDFDQSEDYLRAYVHEGFLKALSLDALGQKDNAAERMLEYLEQDGNSTSANSEALTWAKTGRFEPLEFHKQREAYERLLELYPFDSELIRRYREHLDKILLHPGGEDQNILDELKLRRNQWTGL